METPSYSALAASIAGADDTSSITTPPLAEHPSPTGAQSSSIALVPTAASSTSYWQPPFSVNPSSCSSFPSSVSTCSSSTASASCSPAASTMSPTSPATCGAASPLYWKPSSLSRVAKDVSFFSFTATETPTCICFSTPAKTNSALTSMRRSSWTSSLSSSSSLSSTSFSSTPSSTAKAWVASPVPLSERAKDVCCLSSSSLYCSSDSGAATPLNSPSASAPGSYWASSSPSSFSLSCSTHSCLSDDYQPFPKRNGFFSIPQCPRSYKFTPLPLAIDPIKQQQWLHQWRQSKLRRGIPISHWVLHPQQFKEEEPHETFPWHQQHQQEQQNKKQRHYEFEYQDERNHTLPYLPHGGLAQTSQVKYYYDEEKEAATVRDTDQQQLRVRHQHEPEKKKRKKKEEEEIKDIPEGGEERAQTGMVLMQQHQQQQHQQQQHQKQQHQQQQHQQQQHQQQHQEMHSVIDSGKQDSRIRTGPVVSAYITNLWAYVDICPRGFSRQQMYLIARSFRCSEYSSRTAQAVLIRMQRPACTAVLATSGRLLIMGGLTQQQAVWQAFRIAYKLRYRTLWRFIEKKERPVIKHISFADSVKSKTEETPFLNNSTHHRPPQEGHKDKQLGQPRSSNSSNHRSSNNSDNNNICIVSSSSNSGSTTSSSNVTSNSSSTNISSSKGSILCTNSGSGEDSRSRGVNSSVGLAALSCNADNSNGVSDTTATSSSSTVSVVGARSEGEILCERWDMYSQEQQTYHPEATTVEQPRGFLHHHRSDRYVQKSEEGESINRYTRQVHYSGDELDLHEEENKRRKEEERQTTSHATSRDIEQEKKEEQAEGVEAAFCGSSFSCLFKEQPQQQEQQHIEDDDLRQVRREKKIRNLLPHIHEH